MKSNKIALLFLILVLLAGWNGCSGGGSSAPAKTLVSINVTPSTASIALGMTQQFTAIGVYSDNSFQEMTAQVTWTSSSMNVAIVSNQPGSNGLASSIGQGTTLVTASLGNVSNSATLLVTAPKTLVSINVTPSTASIALGMSQQFTATGVYSDTSTQDLTTAVVWSSSSQAVATIDNASGKNGLAASVSAGTTTISAALGNISSTNSPTLTVTAAKLASITVTPAEATISAGTTQQYSAQGTYTDNSQADITSSATWSSSAPDVATISAGGLATSPTMSIVTAATATTMITATKEASQAPPF